MKIRTTIHDLWYKFKCRFFHPYNVIKIKTLPYTWSDRDHVLAHSCFQILDDFIVKEKIDDIIDWDSDPEYRQARDKMDELNNWFHNIYLKFDSWEGIEIGYLYDDDMFIPCEDYPELFEMKPFTQEQQEKMNLVHKRELDMEQELEKKLREILDIRKYLWT